MGGSRWIGTFSLILGKLRLIMHELQLMLKLEEGYPFAPHPFHNVDLECNTNSICEKFGLRFPLTARAEMH